MSRIQAILYDLDGTLINSLSAAKACYDLFVSELGKRADPSDFNDLNGANLQEIVKYTLNRHGLNGDVERLVKRYNQTLKEYYLTHVEPMPFADNLLRKIHMMGIAQYIVTSAPKDLMSSLVAKYGWSDYIAGFICGDQVQRAKPDPEIYNAAKEMFRVSTQNALVVEDSVNGARAAMAAGFQVLLVGEAQLAGVVPVGTLEDVLHHLDTHSPDDGASAIQLIDEFDSVSINIVPSVECAGNQQLVDSLWEALLAKRPSMFNGCIFYLLTHNQKGRVLELIVAASEYKYYATGQLNNTWGEPLLVMAVTGITFYRVDGITHYLFGVRSEACFQDGGRIELVPSGSLDCSAQRGNTLDYMAQLRLELSEETGIHESQIIELRPIALVYDREGRTADICCLIEVSPSIMNSGKLDGSVEYLELISVDQESLEAYIDENSNRLSEMTRNLLEYILRANDKR